MTTITTAPERATQIDLLTQLQTGARAARVALTGHGPRPLTEPVAPVTSRRPAPAGAPVTVTGSAPPVDVDTLLATRVSQRFYADTALDPRHLAAALLQARDKDVTCWPDDEPVDLLVVADRVDGLAPGLHRAEPDLDAGTVTFHLLAELTRADVEDMVMQLEFAAAPAILMAVASLDAHLQRWGDHGEPLMNRRAGQAVATALLTVQRRGGAGQIFAGCLPGGLARHLTVDGYYRAQVLAAAVGNPWTP